MRTRTETTTTAVGYASQALTTTLYNPQGSNPNDPNLEATRHVQPENTDRAGGHAARRPNEHLRQWAFKCDRGDKVRCKP